MLLLVAALCSSLSAIARRCRFGFSHETARQALAANLPGLGQLTRGLVAALWIAKLRLETTVTLPARHKREPHLPTNIARHAQVGYIIIMPRIDISSSR
ncbi:MAG: hypothetical protein L0Z62_38235 [Gemmataceae bacterium]|nr:hypothetical protein [Gemmataceae bacterium]